MNTKIIQLGFVLGRDYALSVAEIFAFFARKGISTKTLLYDKNILIIETDAANLDTISINELGGTIKIFEVLGKFDDIANLKTKINEMIPFESEKRINFGISGYGKLSKKIILELGYEIKELIVANGHSARFVTGKNIELSSVIVHENKLIERGFEAIIYEGVKTYILGKTLAVQDYKAYSKRDFGRPRRDDRNGMLPPKLAQIMINLAEAQLGAAIYDPFCGSGTVLQEAIMLGYKNVYGSDIEQKNVEDTKENLEWLLSSHPYHSEQREESRQDSKILRFVQNDERIFTSDVLSPSREISADAIVGEGFLGEPTRRNKDQAIHDANELTEFYLKALANLAAQLQTGGRIILAIPFFVIDKEYIYLPILERISETGLNIVKPNLDSVEIRLLGRGNLTYSRSDQFVGREILILEKLG